jgi:hypothetical protein
VHSGTFGGSAANWSTWSKEGYALVMAVTSNRTLLHGDPFSVYTDHRNLLFLLSPESVNVGESSQAASRIARWVLLLSGYRFSIQHIAGGGSRTRPRTRSRGFARQRRRWPPAQDDGIEGSATSVAAIQMAAISHRP